MSEKDFYVAGSGPYGKQVSRWPRGELAPHVVLDAIDPDPVRSDREAAARAEYCERAGRIPLLYTCSLPNTPRAGRPVDVELASVRACVRALPAGGTRQDRGVGRARALRITEEDASGATGQRGGWMGG